MKSNLVISLLVSAIQAQQEMQALDHENRLFNRGPAAPANFSPQPLPNFSVEHALQQNMEQVQVPQVNQPRKLHGYDDREQHESWTWRAANDSAENYYNQVAQ